MGLVNLDDRTRDAIASIDQERLSDLVNEAIRSGYVGELSRLPLYSCGEMVTGKLAYFDRTLTAHRSAKSAKKRERTEYDARKAGSDLIWAVSMMKDRLETEEREGQLFYVFDPMFPAHLLTKRMSARVTFRWRRSANGEWTQGSIVFNHEVRPRFDIYEATRPKPKRKPSVAELDGKREEELYREWSHLEKLAHWSVCEYLRAGFDGASIPKEFDVRVGRDCQLDNFSTKFWVDAVPD